MKTEEAAEPAGEEPPGEEPAGEVAAGEVDGGGGMAAEVDEIQGAMEEGAGVVS